MKNVSLVLVMTVLMFTSITQAAYTIHQFPVYEGSGVQANPDIDGDMAVWQSSDTDIYWKQIGAADPNVIAISGEQTDPAVNSGIIVWLDKSDSDHDIYGYDTTNQSNLIITEQDGLTQREPGISGSIVVYRAGTEVYIHPIGGTASPVAPAAGARYESSVDAGIVVWVEMVGGLPQVLVRDTATADSPLHISPSTFWQRYPAVSGDWIVWQENSGPNQNITVVAHNIQTAATWSHTIESATTAINAYPTVSNGIIVWQEYNGSTYDIWAVDLAEASPVPFEVSDGTGDNRRPAISGKTIVWQNDGDIHAAELLEPSTVTVTSPNGGEQFMAGSEMEISWTSVGDVNDVKIMFSPDDEQSWQTVTESTENDGAFTWAVPADANSIQCRIHISDVAYSSTWDMSDNMFTVFQCDAAMTADLTGDCFVDMADFAELAYQWLTCGNPHDPTWCDGN